MRIKIKFKKSSKQVPINNQSILNSYIHNCLGRNNKYHDSSGNYTISHLYGGKFDYDTKMLNFDNGGFVIVTSTDSEFINKLLIGVLNNPILVNDMHFSSVEYIEEEVRDGWNHFATLSPFLIKEKGLNNRYSFVTLKDDKFESKVKTYLINKLSKIDNTLDLSDFDVNIPKNSKHKVKKILVKNVINSANQCQINIHTNKKVAKLLYDIGIGQSTGSGFGTIYKTENHHLYH